MKKHETNTNVNLNSIFHDLLSDSDRLEFLKAEISNLSLEQQAHIVVEAFGKMQDYIDVNRMCVEVLKEDNAAVLTIN